MQVAGGGGGRIRLAVRGARQRRRAARRRAGGQEAATTTTGNARSGRGGGSGRAAGRGRRRRGRSGGEGQAQPADGPGLRRPPETPPAARSQTPSRGPTPSRRPSATCRPVRPTSSAASARPSCQTGGRRGARAARRRQRRFADPGGARRPSGRKFVRPNAAGDGAGRPRPPLAAVTGAPDAAGSSGRADPGLDRRPSRAAPFFLRLRRTGRPRPAGAGSPTALPRVITSGVEYEADRARWRSLKRWPARTYDDSALLAGGGGTDRAAAAHANSQRQPGCCDGA